MTHTFRDLAPQGVCDPPNPWIYEQLARLCASTGPTSSALATQPSELISSSLRTYDHHVHFTDEDPDNRPYIWDLEEHCEPCQ